MSYILYKYDTGVLTVLLADSERGVQSSVQTYLDTVLAKSATTSSHIQTIPLTEGTVVTIYYRCIQDEIQCYVLCYVCDGKTQLSAFYHELDRYTDEMRGMVLDYDNSQVAVKQNLESWYSECITYVLRVVDYFRADLAALLYIALARNYIQVYCTNVTSIYTDTIKFISSCSLKELIYNTEVKLCEADSTDDIMIDFVNSAVNYNTNKFCRRWAEQIEYESDPYKVRQHMEDYKIVSNQDMNIFRRLLRQAETDHYSFYQAYEFLKHHDNGDVILDLAIHESTVYSIQGSDKLLAILQNFILQKAAKTLA